MPGLICFAADSSIFFTASCKTNIFFYSQRMIRKIVFKHQLLLIPAFNKHIWLASMKQRAKNLLKYLD